MPVAEARPFVEDIVAAFFDACSSKPDPRSSARERAIYVGGLVAGNLIRLGWLRSDVGEVFQTLAGKFCVPPVASESQGGNS